MVVNLLFDSVPSDGGGYYESLDTSIELANRIDIKVLVLTDDNLQNFRKIGISSEKIKLSKYTRLLNKLESTTFIPLRAQQSFIQENVHFLSPSRTILNKKIGVFSGTVWDLCHIDASVFPEVGSYKEYNYRNYILEKYVSRMNFVVADSDENSQKLEQYYRIPQDRIIVLPFSIPKNIKFKPVQEIADVGNYFFYPAQLWRHKNHKNLLNAFARFLQYRSDYSLVLAGGPKDPEVLQEIKEFCGKYPNNIKYLGFVEYDCITWLHKGCSALVFPSYFGPTNIPPLEAINQGSDAILSQSMQQVIGDVATYFDPSDPQSIFEKLLQHTKNDLRDISGKKNFITNYNLRRKIALDLLAEKLMKQSII